jgi:hypothetical protein
LKNGWEKVMSHVGKNMAEITKARHLAYFLGKNIAEFFKDMVKVLKNRQFISVITILSKVYNNIRVLATRCLVLVLCIDK